MDYTYEDVLSKCKEVLGEIAEGKNRRLLDRRNYLIALLHYGFHKTEHALAEALNMKRDTLTSAKLHPYQLMENNDWVFKENVSDLIELFPYKFPNHYLPKTITRNTIVRVYFDDPTIKKLRSYMDFKSIERVDVAVKDLVTKALKLWEE
jgi:hypothetical protein